MLHRFALHKNNGLFCGVAGLFCSCHRRRVLFTANVLTLLRAWSFENGCVH
uniref:Lipoprotein n=2 Tax=Anguilla anguilla TaxID=7936 RepID=A0A0E9RPT7_ANGAN